MLVHPVAAIVPLVVVAVVVGAAAVAYRVISAPAASTSTFGDESHGLALGRPLAKGDDGRKRHVAASGGLEAVGA